MKKTFAIKRYKKSSFPSIRNAYQKLDKEIMDYAENNPDLKKDGDISQTIKGVL
ncbi:hypothetical protein H4J59_15780 [Colwellia sp. MB02u-10]|jgi:hypothetical protein|uniref:hypothetical protein n=1 Tax=Colwellia sp. MB02u-10 TaxID=2759828 RepID=UPI0015F358C5|nr:hypothetical protein [Colwellia sp. MB02u-10]MBA6342453.1 hypothetical protein [Colwellia sp. MB02u-10]